MKGRKPRADLTQLSQAMVEAAHVLLDDCLFHSKTVLEVNGFTVEATSPQLWSHYALFQPFTIGTFLLDT